MITCSVCGDPATSTVHDVIEVKPENGYRQYVPYQRLYLCDIHKRGSIMLVSDIALREEMALIEDIRAYYLTNIGEEIGVNPNAQEKP